MSDTDDPQNENTGINQKIPLENADSIIITNILFQGFVTMCIILAYLVFRRKATWLYSPNTKNRPHHPCYNHTGVLNWIIPVLTVSDTILLSVIGLDAFMMLQTLKLLYRILFILSLVVVPSLGYLFWSNQRSNVQHSDQWLIRFSIGSLDPDSNSYGLIIPVVYFVSLFVMYSIFIYYKRYIVLRQAYLRNPAIMTPIATLKKLSMELGSADSSTEYVNLPNRTLILSRLPTYVKNDGELLEFMNSLGIGEIDECVLIYDTSTLQHLYNQRDDHIHNIEREINMKLIKMNEWSGRNQNMCIEGIPGFQKDIFSTVENSGIEGMFNDAQKKQLALIFMNGAKEFENTYKDGVSRICFYLDRLSYVTERISNEKESIRDENVRDRNTRIVELVSRHNSLFLRGDISSDASFFSFHHVFNYRRFKMYFTLDLPFTAKRGFVTFKDQRSANIVKQSQIGSRIFSVAADDAPAPNDIIWENITKSEVENYIYSILGTLFFILFTVLFLYTAINVARLVSKDAIEALTKESAFISSLMTRYKAISNFIKGILSPLIYNGMLLFVPTVITALVNMEGIYSHSVQQQKLMEKLNNFLFFNGFISVFFGMALYDLLYKVLFENGRLYDVIDIFSEESLEYSVFFANTIIQRSFIGTALVLLKPVPLLMNYILFPFTGRKTRRQLFESEFSPPFDFGTVFPTCLTVFSMCIVYTVICPPILILGTLFYFCNYLTFKSEFLYASRNEYESGGGYWDSACHNIIFSLLFFQIATFAKMAWDSSFYLSILLLPMIFVTILFHNSLRKMFYKSCHFYPLNIKEEEYLDTFTESMLVDRVNLLESWSEVGTGPDADILSLADLGIKDLKEVEKESYYKDPNTTITRSSLIFPKSFFKTIWFLMNNDRGNLFKLRKE